MPTARLFTTGRAARAAAADGGSGSPNTSARSTAALGLGGEVAVATATPSGPRGSPEVTEPSSDWRPGDGRPGVSSVRPAVAGSVTDVPRTASPLMPVVELVVAPDVELGTTTGL